MEDTGDKWIEKEGQAAKAARSLTIPAIRTDRLTMRELHEGDAAAIQHMVSNWEVAKQTLSFPNPYTLDHAQKFISSTREDWEKKEGFALGLERHRDGVLIGAMSATIHRGLFRKEAEIGYWLGEEFWGQGFTSEAVEAFLGFCRHSLRIRRFSARVFAENEASLRLLENFGFQFHRRQARQLPDRGGKREIIHLRLKMK